MKKAYRLLGIAEVIMLDSGYFMVKVIPSIQIHRLWHNFVDDIVTDSITSMIHLLVIRIWKEVYGDVQNVENDNFVALPKGQEDDCRNVSKEKISTGSGATLINYSINIVIGGKLFSQSYLK